jgi:hypothetical protein
VVLEKDIEKEVTLLEGMAEPGYPLTPRSPLLYSIFEEDILRYFFCLS